MALILDLTVRTGCRSLIPATESYTCCGMLPSPRMPQMGRSLKAVKALGLAVVLLELYAAIDQGIGCAMRLSA